VGKGEVVHAKESDMISIKRSECPACGSLLERSMSPSGATCFGLKKQPFTYWNFYCINENCNKVWRVSKHLYKKAFGAWPDEI
jgi:hypothetical protein